MTGNKTIYSLPLIVGMLAICLGLIQTIFIAGLLYGNYIGLDLSLMLKINFLTIFIVFMGIIFIVLTLATIQHLNIIRNTNEDNFNL